MDIEYESINFETVIGWSNQQNNDKAELLPTIKKVDCSEWTFFNIDNLVAIPNRNLILGLFPYYDGKEGIVKWNDKPISATLPLKASDENKTTH